MATTGVAKENTNCVRLMIELLPEMQKILCGNYYRSDKTLGAMKREAEISDTK